MSGTNTTQTTPSGTALSSLPVASAVSADDKVWGVVGGKAQLVGPEDFVAAGLPSDVVKTDDLNAALSGSALGQYTDQAAKSAATSAADANRSETAQAAASANADKTAATGVQVAAIAESAKTNNDAAQQAVEGVTADANAAKVLLTSAVEGNSPLNYRGYWNASSNTPALSSGVGTEGDLYIVSVAGTTTLDGNSAWDVLDGAWFTGGRWVYFARAGFAAFAKQFVAAGSVTAGQNRFSNAGGGDLAQVWIDATARMLAALTSDGSFVSYGATARFANKLLSTTGLVSQGELTIGGDFSVLRNTTTARWPGVQTRPTVALRVQSRPPGRFDDATCGYAVGDSWQYNGTLYRCTRNGARGAVWSRDVAGIDAPYTALFGDALLDVWSLKRAVPAYTGPLIDVQIKQDGVWSAAVSVGQNAAGGLDTLTLNGLLAQRDAGTRAAVVRWYGQNGSYHLTANPDTAPHIGETTVNGAPAISYDTTGSGVAQSLTSATLPLPQAGFSVLTVGRYSGTNTSLGENVAMLTAGNGTTNRISTVTGLREDGRVGIYAGSGGWINGTLPQKTSPSVAGLVWNGTAAQIVHGTETDTLTVPASAVTGALSGLSLGCLTHDDGDTGNPSNLVLTEAVALTDAVTEDGLTAYNAAMAVRHNLVPQTSYEWHAIGDSRTAGYINPDGYNWPAIAIEEGYLDTPAALYNWAVSGSTTVDFAGYTQASVVAAIQAATRPVICTIWLGVNDYGKLGASPALVAQRISAIASALLTAGARHVFVLNEVDAASQGQFTAALGSAPGITLVNPFSPDLPLFNTADTDLWHADKTHPLPDADRAIAAIVSTEINKYLEDAA